MNTDEPLALLGGLSAKTFMQRHWQKKPLVIRQAIPGFAAPVLRADLLELAAQEEVQSRLIVQNTGGKGPAWTLRHGPFSRRALPAFNKPGWTLLVQGVDLLDERIHALMNQFRFVPDARLDDVMVSYASDGGGVGPHFDSYDVFLLQAHGQRRWRIGRQKDLSLQADMPLKILAQFEHEEEFVLNAGDMLYLPPKYAHDGVAVGECMTYSIGFRAPSRGELAGELLQRLADEALDMVGADLYRDPKQDATPNSGAIPVAMVEFARDALAVALKDPMLVSRALGEYLSEPKPHVSFDGGGDPAPHGAPLRLDRRTRMMYDEHHVYINGEGFKASGRDAQAMRLLADTRCLSGSDAKRLSAGAQALVADWVEAGWLHADE
jgi:50S ribosomal protein L16 3-hydroxylase